MVVIILKNGATRDDAETVASDLNGKIVGYYDYINLYQIEYHTFCAGHTESDLKRQLLKARQEPCVEYAYPDSLPELEQGYEEIEVSPLRNPVYAEGGRDSGYELVGAETAWNILRATHVPLAPVRIAILDDGIYTGYHEFDTGVSLDTSTPGSTLSSPLKGWEHTGSHGTGVANIIGAYTSWKGITGIASEAMRENLTMDIINIRVPPYGYSFESMTTGQNGTPVFSLDAKTYSVGNIVAIKDAIEHGATIISISWGNSQADPDDAATYRKFFEKVNREYPSILFVCSAGNDNRALNGSLRYPSGLALPGMITVGNVRNDGTNRARSSMKSANYEVTLAAPGQQAVYGYDSLGNVTHMNGGSSMAVPHVTAAAALLRSLDPSLSAGEIKQILVDTARTEVLSGNRTVQAPPELGGRILAVDRGTLAVINALRSREGLPAVSEADAENSTDIFLTLEKDPANPGNYTVSALVPAGLDAGTDIHFALESGETVLTTCDRHLDSLPGKVNWSVQVTDVPSRIVVTRSDSNSEVFLAIGN
ncbi:MAG: S8/S53 family peptidase [Methanoregulaceae archaeon]